MQNKFSQSALRKIVIVIGVIALIAVLTIILFNSQISAMILAFDYYRVDA